MRLTGMLTHAVATVWVGAVSTGCVALRPRTTLDGRFFPAARVIDIRAGQTESQVRALLGEPYEVLKSGENEVWRYYERFEPRGCDDPPPTITREFSVYFRNGSVVGTEPEMKPPEVGRLSEEEQLPNKWMQLTRSAHGQAGRGPRS